MAREQPVRFAPGASSATLNGSITGDAGMDYLVPASAGQTLSVSLLPDNGRAYFNVLPPDGDSAIFIGSTLGNRFSGVLAASGTHRIRVYQMRARARRGSRLHAHRCAWRQGKRHGIWRCKGCRHQL